MTRDASQTALLQAYANQTHNQLFIQIIHHQLFCLYEL